ncbi:right-handed parallel beta-helix repeat-containing protein [bacterium]|nr:right-handed parallel beta-helix repeat-containing protein [bacterium]
MYVPAEYGTINGALAASSAGDTVLVAIGSYAEHIVMPPGERTLAGSFLITGDTSAIEATTLLPDTTISADSQSIVSIFDATTQAELIGFLLQDGNGTRYSAGNNNYGGAVLQLDGNVTIRHCLFRNNEAFIGSAVFADTGFTRLCIESCDFSHNTVFQGTVAAYGIELAVRGSRFHHNTGPKSMAVYVRYANFVFENCVVDSNRNDYVGGPAVWSEACSSLLIANSAFRANSSDTIASFPAPLCLGMYYTSGVLDSCTFEDNVGIAIPALSVAEGDVRIENCVFRRNRTTQYGAIVSLVQESMVEFRGCLFDANTAIRWPGVAVVDQASFESCRFINNVADRPDTCGVLSGVLSTSEIVAHDCVFEGNRPYATYNCYLPTPTFNVRNCWWGDPSGPFHATRNPQGLGDAICGDSLLFEPWLLEPPATSDDPLAPFIPSEFSLLRAYPNPFNSQVMIEFTVARALSVRLEVFDLLGRRVATLADGPRDPGMHRVTWNAGDQSSGIYFARLASPAIRQKPATQKLVLLK